MSLAQVTQADRGPASPLMSNNPFRNKITSTQPPAQSVRPVSTNPFLDPNEPQKEPLSSVKPVPADSTNGATQLFAAMDIGRSQPSPERNQRPAPNGAVSRPENFPPRLLHGPPPSHRPTLSDEERRRQVMPPRRGTEMDIFADPTGSASLNEQKSTRRNSESSVRDKPNSLDPEEEKRRRDKKSKDPRYNKYRPSRRMDIIDKLDVTSIYGAGLFHHDGPFDACNPNRNKRRHRYAPMQAFPKDSANMMIGGSGPLKKQMDYDKFHGYGQEAHIDYNEAAVVEEEVEYVRRPQPGRSASFNPNGYDAVHGSESAGLGTSTFLEGAPASRIAIERRESEINEVQPGTTGGGLSRKKSLAQKFRGRIGTGRVQSPDSDRPPNSPALLTGKSDSVVNPFFKDYDKDGDRKGQQTIQPESQTSPGRARALSSPKPIPELENKQTVAETPEVPQESKPTGILGRMKSLKKTKSRLDRREAT